MRTWLSRFCISSAVFNTLNAAIPKIPPIIRLCRRINVASKPWALRWNKLVDAAARLALLAAALFNGGKLRKLAFKPFKVVPSPARRVCKLFSTLPRLPIDALTAALAVARPDKLVRVAVSAVFRRNAAASALFAAVVKLLSVALTAFVSLLKTVMLGLSCLMALFRLLTPLLPLAPFMVFNTLAIDCPLWLKRAIAACAVFKLLPIPRIAAWNVVAAVAAPVSVVFA